MGGFPFYETFSKIFLNMLLNCCQSSCEVVNKNIIGNVILLVIMQTKSFYLLFVDFFI